MVYTSYSVDKLNSGNSLLLSRKHKRNNPDNSSDFTAIIFNYLHKRKPVIDAFPEFTKNLDYQFIVFNGDAIDDLKKKKNE